MDSENIPKIQQQIIDVIQKFQVALKEKEEENQTPIIHSNNKAQGQMNPFLIFHSPDESQKSPFRKTKKIMKQNRIQVNSKYRPIFVKSMISQQDIGKLQSFNEQLCFTQRKRANNKMGMLIISRICEQRTKNNLVYSSTEKTVINIPKCEKCGRMFKNHAGLGGHMRICNKPLIKIQASQL